MHTEDDSLEIKVQSYIWKSGVMYLTGHYEFEIIIKSKRGKNIEQKTIYRRFSDLELLHDGLIKYNPGSRIPPLPEKSIWCNLYFKNDNSLEKRKFHIEEYMNYINHHKYLVSNPIFLIFISDDFETYKAEYSNKKTTFYEKIYSLKKYFPKMFKNSTPRGLYTGENNLENERENLIRLDNGISFIKCFLENYLKMNYERTEALKNILNISKTIENTNLKIEQTEFDEDYKQSKKSNEQNLEILYNLYDKNKVYCNILNNNVIDLFNRYHVEVIGLREIFERKDKLHEILNKKNKIVDNLIDVDNPNLKDIFHSMDEQLLDEIKTFKTNRESDLLNFIKKIFREKYEYHKEVFNVFEGNSSNNYNFNLTDEMSLRGSNYLGK